MASSRRNPLPGSPSFVLLFAIALLVAGMAAAAEPLVIHAAAALKGPINELAAAFERTHGQRMVPVFDTAGAAEQKFLAGDGAGILISSATDCACASRPGRGRRAGSDGILRRPFHPFRP